MGVSLQQYVLVLIFSPDCKKVGTVHIFFYVLETGNPQELKVDQRGGKEVIRVIICFSKIQQKAFLITFEKGIAVGY